MNFPGDQVSLKTDCLKYGSVLYTSVMHSDGNTEQMLNENSHNVHVQWYPSGKYEIISNDKVELTARFFTPGKVVSKIKENKQNQFGFCTNIDKYATVKILNTDKIIENISNENFISTKTILVDSMVFYETWVGVVKNVSYIIRFASQDGYIFTINDPDRMDFIHISSSDEFTEDSNVFYYGQKLKIRLDDLKKLQFIERSKLMTRRLWNNNHQNPEWIFLYVLNVTPLEVEVSWRSKILSLEESENVSQPETIFNKDNIKNLKANVIFNNNRDIFLGDTYLYEIKKNENLITMEQLRKKYREFNNTELGPLNNKSNTGRGSQNVINQNIKKMKQKCKKLKNRKNTEKSKIKKYPISTSKSHTFGSMCRFKLNRLNMYRTRKLSVTKGKKFKLPRVSLKPNSCVVVKVIYTKFLVDVIWQDGTVETGISSSELYSVENLELENFPGDLVMELKPSFNDYGVIECVNRVERTARVQWFKNNPQNHLAPNPTEKTNLSLYDLCEYPYYNFEYGSFVMYVQLVHPDFHALFYGIVLHSSPDGNYLVLLDNGEKKLCSPQSLIDVIECDVDSGDYVFQSNNSQSEEDSYKLYSVAELQSQENTLEEEEEENALIEHSILEESINIMSVSEFNDHNDDNNVINMDVKNIETTTEIPSMLEMPTECERIAKPEEAGVFEMLETLLDNSHIFMNDNVGTNTSTLNAICKDISILQNSLPSGIWVKTFENRLDLFCVMIRGPERTPYAGGLFMFDFKIPINYPVGPPLCHYYSYCMDRLNPNLYEDGKVCLSLLGTWHGEGSEIWLPNKSNLLQIFVSIQGLILVNEPYFNEPGSEIQHGQKLSNEYSRVYNERTLLKVVQSMTNMLTMIKMSDTPSCFINEITEYVTFHGPKLINSIKKWMKVSENELSEDDKLEPGFPLLPLSKGFCLAIEKPLQDYNDVLVCMNILTN